MSKKSTKRFKYYILLFYFITYIYVINVRGLPLSKFMAIFLVLTLALVPLFYRSILGLLGNYHYAAGNNNKADKYLKKAIDKNTAQPTVYLNYSISLMKNSQGEEALNYLQKASALGAKTLTDKNILLAMASCYLTLNDPEKAIATIETLMNKYDDAGCHALTTLGYAYLLTGEIDKAIAHTQKAIDENPECSAAWDNLGQVYLKNNDYEKAKESFEKALEFDENLADSNFYLGIIYEQLGHAQLAKNYFEKAAQCPLTPLNTIKREQIDHMHSKYETL